MYLPKSAYWKMQEDLARVLPNGIYRLSPQLQPDICLGTSNKISMEVFNFGVDRVMIPINDVISHGSETELTAFHQKVLLIVVSRSLV
jgi:hypothetical protein